jgi:hypothetical protein
MGCPDGWDDYFVMWMDLSSSLASSIYGFAVKRKKLATGDS